MLNNLTNFYNLISSRMIKKVPENTDLMVLGTHDPKYNGGYKPTAITVEDFIASIPIPTSPSAPTDISIEGSSYILIKANGTAEENGAELEAAYEQAKLATPYNYPLSNVNRFTILVPAGIYITSADHYQFVFDTDYIDIVSLSGNADVYLSGITVSATDILVKGIDTSKAIDLGGEQPGFNLGAYGVNQVFDTCIGGNYSFGWGGTLTGTFINCIAGNNSFASAADFSPPVGITEISPAFFTVICAGTFTNCAAGDNSFGVGFIEARATGNFTNCTAKTFSFGATVGSFGGGRASGLFKNCEGTTFCFAPDASAFTGTAYNCISGSNSFANEVNNGSLYYCKSSGTLPGVNPFVGGRIVLCIENGTTVVTEVI